MSTPATPPTPEPAPVTVATSTPQPGTVASYRAALIAEWGTYRANKQLWIDGALAFNPGDPVPVSHVQSGIVLSEDVDTVKKG